MSKKIFQEENNQGNLIEKGVFINQGRIVEASDVSRDPNKPPTENDVYKNNKLKQMQYQLIIESDEGYSRKINLFAQYIEDAGGNVKGIKTFGHQLAPIILNVLQDHILLKDINSNKEVVDNLYHNNVLNPNVLSALIGERVKFVTYPIGIYIKDGVQKVSNDIFGVYHFDTNDEDICDFWFRNVPRKYNPEALSFVKQDETSSETESFLNAPSNGNSIPKVEDLLPF